MQHKIEPTPKKRKSRKLALSSLDVNAPRVRAARAKVAASAASPHKRPAAPQQRRGQLGFGSLGYNHPPTANPLVGFGRKYSDEDDEFRMTMADLGGIGSKKRPFNIFQDAPEISPVRTESPLEEPRYVLDSNGIN
jgi:hypothetical protein